MHFVKGHHCGPNFLAQPIRREEKFGPISNLPSLSRNVSLVNGQTDRLASPYRERGRDKERQRESGCEREREKERENKR
jgi:hypothetical protein